ncbi:MAG: transposase [Candidatus Omnitrophota bacterium]
MNKYPKRKQIRLKNYDYSQPGYYYITICIDNRECIFGDIIDNRIYLNNVGKMVDQTLRTLPEYYQNITIDNYIVMPNHIHGIIQIVGAGFPCPNNIINQSIHNHDNNNPINGRGNHAPTINYIIGYFKYQSTKQINKLQNTPGKKIWQRSFYDHVIRTNDSLNKIREYIVNNPATWVNDEHNIINYSIEDKACLVPTGYLL